MKHNMRTTYNCNIEIDCNYNNNDHYHASVYIYNYTVLTAVIIVYNNNVMVYDHDEVSGNCDDVYSYIINSYAKLP